MGFTIYYSDGSAFEGAVEDAPTRDVQVIVSPCQNTGWTTEHSQNYYVWRDDLSKWQGADAFGLWDYLARPGWKKVVFGYMVSEQEFNAIFRRAKADRDERKAGFRATERKPTEA